MDVPPPVRLGTFLKVTKLLPPNGVIGDWDTSMFGGSLPLPFHHARAAAWCQDTVLWPQARLQAASQQRSADYRTRSQRAPQPSPFHSYPITATAAVGITTVAPRLGQPELACPASTSGKKHNTMIGPGYQQWNPHTTTHLPR